MIAKIEGNLTALDGDLAQLKVGPITYEIMLPGCCVQALSGSIGSDVTLCTSQYYEGAPGGGNLVPRLIGFLSDEERDFFRKYTSVKGIGTRKALRSLAVPIPTIAAAIENEDTETLISLPGIGKRMAQQIVTQLKGRLGSFAGPGTDLAASNMQLQAFQTEALEILIAWGEKRNEVLQLISRACTKHPGVDSAEALVPLVYKLKQGIEV